VLFASRSSSNWHFEIDFIARTNFASNTWLKITNRIGSRLRLWWTNGVEITSTNPSILAINQLPARMSVEALMQGVRPRSRRGTQWLWTKQGMPVAATTFDLHEFYNIPFTNDFEIKLAPLLYRVDTNHSTARLVEFPPIQLKLLSSGQVERVSGE
jgi:hypothetical protein